MSRPKPSRNSPLSRVRLPIGATRASMAAERVVVAFWPLFTLVALVFAALAFRIVDVVAPTVLLALGAVIVALAVWALVFGVRRFRLPSVQEARNRLDASLSGRPIQALQDTPALGENDPQAAAVWRAHLKRMAERAAQARAPRPDLRVSGRDPFALRLIAGTALILALMFGALSRVGDVSSAVVSPLEASSGGPSWEGWVEPPLYTGRPSLYLNDILQGEFSAPLGSRVTVRFYGSDEALSLRETISTEPRAEGSLATDPAQEVVLGRSGTLAVDGPGGQAWEISVLPDQPPVAAFDGELVGIPPGQMQLGFSATDDYGVVSGRAIIRLNPSAADRRFGLAVDPEPREPVILDLPMPFSGSRTEFTELLIDDLSEHPYANLPVTISLEVFDHAGQMGSVSQTFDRLPGRRFFDPRANALIEMRRDLLWSRENARRTMQILRAITWQGEELFDDGAALLLIRGAIRRLESGVDSLSEETRDEVAEILWRTALMIEEGDLADALEQLRRAQDRLQEAMRQGASDEEIAQLMDELRQAMDEYMQQLAENAQPGTDQPDQSGETQEMSMADIEEMMRRIEELIQQGRMAEAQQLMDQLRQMMENMQMTQGDGGGDGPRTPGQEAMEGLQDTLRDQQDLSDDSFQELQEQFGNRQPPNQPGQQSQPGQPGQQGQQQGQQAQNGQPQGQPGQQGQPQGQAQAQGGPQVPGETDGGQTGQGQGGEADGRSLAERQQDLLRQLQDQAQNLPGGASEEGEEALRRLQDAGRAMDDAADALENGDIAGALDDQSDALEALREGMAQLGRALAEEQGLQEQGQGQAEGNLSPDSPMQDPLGRQAGNSGAFGSEESFEQREEAFRRSRELLEELRRRSAELDRSDTELDYLRRLLERF
ncbi:MAG: DUF4175 domain-containing protein [Pseudomonadota bacterium]